MCILRIDRQMLQLNIVLKIVDIYIESALNLRENILRHYVNNVAQNSKKNIHIMYIALMNAHVFGKWHI